MWRFCCEPGTVLGSEGTAVNKIALLLSELAFLLGETDSKQIDSKFVKRCWCYRKKLALEDGGGRGRLLFYIK